MQANNGSGNKRYSATIGFFDGVHKGHQYMVSRLIGDAKEHDLGSAIITFRQHPRQILQKEYIPQLLTLASRKEQLLRSTGADCVVMLDFDMELARMTAKDFMMMMHEKFGVDRLLVGYDHRFGHNRSEGFDDYKHYGKEIGMEVLANDTYSDNDTNISSSVIRRLLSEGNVSQANKYLGYKYGFEGIVVRGHGEGKKLGFPTANMQIPVEQLVPKRGVYAVEVKVEGFDSIFMGMMNIGCRPTYGEFKQTLEVNILDFNTDIYGREVSVHFLRRLRDERRFSSIDELIEQLGKDRNLVRNEELGMKN